LRARREGGFTEKRRERKKRRTWHDHGRSIEKRSNEEILKSDLTLRLKPSVGILDDRDGKSKSDFKCRLVMPFVEQSRGPVL